MTIQKPNELLLETRGRKFIENNLSLETPNVARRAAIEIIRQLHPDAKLRSITATYNCAGLVVASRRAHANPDQLRAILREDGYRTFSDQSEARVGDVVLYLFEGRVEHVGIVAELRQDLLNHRTQIIVVSKWGDGGEYVHDIDDVPSVYGNPTEFWTDRKEVT